MCEIAAPDLNYHITCRKALKNSFLSVNISNLDFLGVM